MAFNYQGDLTETEFSLIPPGTKATVVVVIAEEKTNSAGNGDRVTINVEIVDGEYKGRKLSDGFNINSTAGKNYTIDENRLARLCVILLGKKGYKNISELTNKPFIIEIGTKAGTNEYADKVFNSIKSTEPMTGTYKELKDKINSGGKLSTPSTSYNAPIVDDEIPF